MKEKNDFQLNIKFLNEAVSKSSTSKKRITDNDLKNADLEAVQKHTKAYSDYLEAFVSDFKLKTRNQRKMKIVFFVVTLILLLVIIGGGVGSIFKKTRHCITRCCDSHYSGCRSSIFIFDSAEGNCG